MNFNLKNKLIFFLILVVFLSSIFCSYFAYNLLSQYLIEHKTEEISRIANERKKRIEDFLDSSLLIAEKISQKNEIIEYFGGETDFYNEKIFSILENYKLKKIHSEIYLVNRTGKVLTSTEKFVLGKNYIPKNCFDNVLGGDSQACVFREASDYYFEYYVSYPVKNDGKVVGAIFLRLNSNYLNNFFNDEKNEIEFNFISKEGMIVGSNNSDNLYKSLGSLSEKRKEDIYKNLGLKSFDFSSLEYGSIQNDIFLDKNGGNYEFYNREKKDRELLSLTKIEKHPFYLITKLNFYETLHSIRKVSFLIGLFIVLLGLIINTVVLFFISNKLNSIKKLSEIIRENKKSGFIYMQILKTGDEVEYLSREFKKTSDDFLKFKKVMEIKIKEKDEQLGKVSTLISGRELKMIKLKEKIKELEKKISENKIEKK